MRWFERADVGCRAEAGYAYYAADSAMAAAIPLSAECALRQRFYLWPTRPGLAYVKIAVPLLPIEGTESTIPYRLYFGLHL